MIPDIVKTVLKLGSSTTSIKPLTDSDFGHLEKVLWNDLGTREDYEKEYGDEPLVKLVAGLVGLERSAANELFSEFLTDRSLNSHQMEFVTLVVNYVVENGLIDKTILNDHPFNKHGNIICLFDGKVDVVRGMVARIDELNGRVFA